MLISNLIFHPLQFWLCTYIYDNETRFLWIRKPPVKNFFARKHMNCMGHINSWYSADSKYIVIGRLLTRSRTNKLVKESVGPENQSLLRWSAKTWPNHQWFATQSLHKSIYFWNIKHHLTRCRFRFLLIANRSYEPTINFRVTQVFVRRLKSAFKRYDMNILKNI